MSASATQGGHNKKFKLSFAGILSTCQLHISLTRTAQIYLELHFCVELHTKKPWVKSPSKYAWNKYCTKGQLSDMARQTAPVCLHAAKPIMNHCQRR